ncbi:MAG: hypothetical protein KC516_01245 [Nanoarchaeota archaeon]|nr:hypothetical protein [Nanoarchaeota archaeon]
MENAFDSGGEFIFDKNKYDYRKVSNWKVFLLCLMASATAWALFPEKESQLENILKKEFNHKIDTDSKDYYHKSVYYQNP